MNIAIINGKIITPQKILEDKTLLIEGDSIKALVDGDEYDKEIYQPIINAQGGYITPGFIDTHSDKIEQIIQPRPTSIMDFELAMKEGEKELVNQGITTMYHSLSLFQDNFFGSSSLRSQDNVLKLANLIDSVHNRSHLIRHRLHLRIEIDNLSAYEIVKNMIQQNKVHQISFMDHTPGQGQYRNLEIYRETISAYKSAQFVEVGFEGVLEYHQNKEMMSFEQIKTLANLAKEKNIPLASHDDDCCSKLTLNKELGVNISEFPITLEVAREAREMGFYTVAGAPNILLGGSHSGNMSVAEAICNDFVDVLCSDYYPSALLHSIFIMYHKHGIPLADMVNRVTFNPAKAMMIDDEYGSIETGKKADILVIQILNGYPVISHVLVDGKITSRLQYRL
ncbi:MAG: alpha-D-ribose 1-methylphosphonate 5-triphosphate diphosphatase [Eubacteriales bacterium]